MNQELAVIFRCAMRAQTSVVFSPTMRQLAALIVLYKALQSRLPDVDFSALARKIGLPMSRKGSMSRLCDTLVHHGLINRQSDASDRRRVTLALTFAGRAFLERLTAPESGRAR